MSRGHWTCQKVTGGVKCGHVNPNRYRKCQSCTKPRPARKPPAHMKALEQPYEAFVQVNGGDWCGICGKEGSDTRKLDRDHVHQGDGTVRGLLCHLCNRGLKFFNDDVERLRSAIDYLERSEKR